MALIAKNNPVTEAPRASAGSIIRAAVVSFVSLTVLTGVVYPLAVTAVAKVAFPNQAGGSLIDKDGRPTNDEKAAVGSRLIGQQFDAPHYFWSRPSATSPMGYNAANSSGSNVGPSSILPLVQPRVDALKQADKDAGVTGGAAPPVDLVTASGSGLDPQESIAAAEYQIARVAKVRHTDPAKLQVLIDANTSPRSLGILGEKAVNVLTLNLALDREVPFTPAATTPATR